jgi:hypothetical protein
MNTTDNNQVWIGLAEVVQRPGTGKLLDRNAAFVNILALARDAHEFEAQALKLMDGAGFDIVTIEDVRPLPSSGDEAAPDAGILTLAREVVASGAARHGTFHTWIVND